MYLGQTQSSLTFQGQVFKHIWHADSILVSDSLNTQQLEWKPIGEWHLIHAETLQRL